MLAQNQDNRAYISRHILKQQTLELKPNNNDAHYPALWPANHHAKIYNTKKNSNGDVLYGMDSISGNFCLVIGVTGKATDTGLEKTEYIVLPKTTFGSPSESGQTKSADGTETLQTQQISYTSTALDNGIYKAKTSTLPESITIEMFTPAT